MNTDEVKITSLFVPQYVKKGEEAELKCQWSPNKNIYSLKWYFNDIEFFSYKPGDPTVVTLPADSFKINISTINNTGEKLMLSEVEMAASGSYKCEVTMESPGFLTADKSARMTVVDIPEEKPRITGIAHQYRIGDVANLTCSSAPFILKAHLTWYINNERAPAEYLTPMPSTTHPGGLQVAHKKLRFTVSPKHFRGGKMILRCTASILRLYTKTQQHNAEGLLTYHIPMLPSIEKSAVPGRAGDGGRGRVLAVVIGALVLVEVVGASIFSTPATLILLTSTR
ncbi:uncharacterized protein LOC123511215 [Portunus trituberculatus]|uniref:uncharacterized protein LOC123511215 n=1 Tax=Portunus trituberculatus TaxID=210409 RepID=UPI001E1CBEC0|nr:uncharacterized protein LOC123511215 [Portunus trituberculatus]